MAQSVFMQMLRKRMTTIFVVVAGIFVLTMVLDWGMDITGVKGRKRHYEAIAVVDERPIDYREFTKEYQNQIRNATEQGRIVDDFVYEDIFEISWNAIINRAILEKQFKNKCVEDVSGTEIFERLRRNPPDFIRNNPNFATDGKFDYQKYVQFLMDPAAAKSWEPVEQYIALNLPYEKIQTLVKTMTFVTSLEALDEYNIQKARFVAEYVTIGPDCDPGVIDTSETALRKWYDSHKDSIPERSYAVFNYVSVPYLPSHEDSVSIKSDVDTVYARLMSGEDFELMAEGYSQDPYSSRRGGDIGWYKRGQLLKEFESAAFSLDTGEITHPIMAGGGFHIFKCAEKDIKTDTTGITDTLVHLYHIYVPIQPSPQTAESLESFVNLIRDEAIKSGLSATARKFGLQMKHTSKFGPNEIIPEIGSRSFLNTFAFTEKKGSIPEIQKANGNYYVLELDETVPPKFDNFDQAKDYVKKRILREAMERTCNLFAHKVLDMVKTGTPLKTVAEQFGLEYRVTDTVNVFSDTLRDIWFASAMAFSLQPNSYEYAVGWDGKFYVGKTLWRDSVELTKFNDERHNIAQAIFRAKYDAAYNIWMNTLRRNTSIEDRRAYYYGGKAGEAIPEEK